MQKSPKNFKQHKVLKPEIPRTNNISKPTICEEIKPESQKLLLKKFSYMSKAGKNGNSPKQNQDNYLIIQKINNLPNCNLFSVFDGHGLNGDEVSDYIAKFFNNAFTTSQKLKPLKTESELYNFIKLNNYEFIQNIFNEAERKLKISSIEVNYSGSTCVMLIQIGTHLICCNCGDSRCISVSKNKKIELLSNDHKPNLPDERKRIMSNGGLVYRYENGGIPFGPFRVWKKGEEYPGLAMSRSIGDLVATSLGVIPEPEIIEKEIDADLKFIVLASDGVWEFLSNEKVANIVGEYYDKRDCKRGCEYLVRESDAMWKNQEEDGVDDITAIILFFNI